METEGKRILVNYLTDIADTFRSITGETDTISAESFSKEVQAVATSSSKNSYQRNSVEEMNAITDAKDGDTCLCYHTNSFNITEDRAVGVITFPKKVVFENAITEYYNADIRAVDSSTDLWGMIDLSPNNFNFRVNNLITLGGLKNLGMGYDTGWDANSDSLTLNLSDSPLLTHDSLMNVINNLYDIKSKGVKPQTLQLGNTNKAKLTAEEIAIAINKGWNVI